MPAALELDPLGVCYCCWSRCTLWSGKGGDAGGLNWYERNTPSRPPWASINFMRPMASRWRSVMWITLALRLRFALVTRMIFATERVHHGRRNSAMISR